MAFAPVFAVVAVVMAVRRIGEYGMVRHNAKELLELLQAYEFPNIMLGDFNAGDYKKRYEAKEDVYKRQVAGLAILVLLCASLPYMSILTGYATEKTAVFIYRVFYLKIYLQLPL